MRPILLLALTMFAPALAAGDYIVDHDHQVDFSALHTFTLRGAVVAIDRPEIRNPLIIERTAIAIRAALTARGLREVAADADLRIDWSIQGQGFFVNEWGRAIPLQGDANRTPWQPRLARGGPETFTEGLLVLDMTQVSSGVLVWRGVHREKQKDVARIASRLPDYAKKLLSRYPARSK